MPETPAINVALEKTIELNKELAEKISVSLPIIMESLANTKFKFVSHSLLSLLSRSGYLTDTILFACQSNDIYTSSIIFRALIEHNFRHLYIYTRALKDDSDSIGDEYLNSLKANEDLESIEKIINYKKVVYPEDLKWSTRGEENIAIRNKAKQFRIEQIFYYLLENGIPESDEIIKGGMKEYLLQRLTEYTNMSSSVHGGSFGWYSFSELQKNEVKYEATINRFVTDSFMLHKSLVEATYLFAYLMDSGNQGYYEEIKNLGGK